LPAWCGKELTGHHQLSNAALARHPLQQWSEAELRDLLPSLLFRAGMGEVQDGSN